VVRPDYTATDDAQPFREACRISSIFRQIDAMPPHSGCINFDLPANDAAPGGANDPSEAGPGRIDAGAAWIPGRRIAVAVRRGQPQLFFG
jgi:hypothetical protein